MDSGCGYIEYFQSDDDELDYMISILLERYPNNSKQEIINVAEQVFDENRNMRLWDKERVRKYMMNEVLILPDF